MPFVEIDRHAPMAHRVAYRLTVERVRGSLRVWELAQRFDALPETATMTLGGQPMLIDLADETTSVNIYRGFYERAELAIVQRIVQPGDACVDVGANAGLYTLALRVLSGTDGSVVAFEPNPLMATKLRDLVARTVGADVDVLEVALGSEAGTATLHVFDGASGLATLRNWDVTGTDSVEVEVRRLDDVPEVQALGEIAFLKVDVESWEPQVLSGASRLFEDRRVRAALMELATDSSAPAMADIVNRLSDYQPFLICVERGKLRWESQLRPLSVQEIADGGHQWSNMLLLRDDAAAGARDLVRGT